MPPAVRLATHADVPAILDIYNAAVLNITASYDLEPVSLESRLAWYDDTQASGRPVVVAEVVSEVLGWAGQCWADPSMASSGPNRATATVPSTACMWLPGHAGRDLSTR